jgi:RNA polymerase sigma-70 factor (family 1)
MDINEHSSDYQLMESLRNGDLEAFDLVYKKYGDRLFGFTLSYLKSKEETEELVQDVFLKIWENRKNLKKESSLKSYLFTIAYHNMCRLFRNRKIHEKYREKIGETGVRSINPEEQYEYQTALEQVDQLIDKLPESQRAIFRKSRREGKSTKEIAVEMNLSPGTVDNQISLALKYLRKQIAAYNFTILLFCSIFFD